jgi:hypothetical protein
MKIPFTTRRVLISTATAALHELLKDESIDHVCFDMIEEAQTKLLTAHETMERWEKVTA